MFERNGDCRRWPRHALHTLPHHAHDPPSCSGVRELNTVPPPNKNIAGDRLPALELAENVRHTPVDGYFAADFSLEEPAPDQKRIAGISILGGRQGFEHSGLIRSGVQDRHPCAGAEYLALAVPIAWNFRWPRDHLVERLYQAADFDFVAGQTGGNGERGRGGVDGGHGRSMLAGEAREIEGS